MLDPAGASQALTSASPLLASIGINPAQEALKSSWNTMIEGTWALLYPLIHKEFPSRDEIDEGFLGIAINTSTAISDYSISVNTGLAAAASDGYVPSIPSMADITDLEFIPKITILDILERPIQVINTDPLTEGLAGASTGVPQMAPITAFALSPAIELL